MTFNSSKDDHKFSVSSIMLRLKLHLFKFVVDCVMLQPIATKLFCHVTLAFSKSVANPVLSNSCSSPKVL